MDAAPLLLLSRRGFGQVPVPCAPEVCQQADDTWERLGFGEVFALQGRELGEVLVVGDGQGGPVVEDFVGFDSGTALELGFDGPGEGGAAISLEDEVDAQGVEVFGVEEEAVHVEEAGPHRREADGGGVSLFTWSLVRVRVAYSVRGAIQVLVFRRQRWWCF